MLNCQACLSRCLRALHHDVPIAYQLSLRRNVIPSNPYRQQRLFLRTSASTAAPRARTQNPDPTYFQAKANKVNGDPWSRSKTTIKVKAANILRSQGKKEKPPGHRNRVEELRWLKDPLELANYVRSRLKKDKHVEMIDLVRMASSQMECVVSWNHLLDHTLAKGHVTSAVKLFNEMKKRGQFPDSHTYVIILRGLANHAHIASALTHALSIYHSMSAPNSRVTPAIMHTNAALKVCARAGNMDAMWSVASKIPERGPNAANNLTFTTILNALRLNAVVGELDNETEDEAALRKERVIVEGRRVWEDVIGKWRSSKLIMDEGLVCSMGRLLLVGSRPRDWDDVLTLVEQTMRIPRLVPRLGTPDRPEVPRPDQDPELIEKSATESVFLPVHAHAASIVKSNPLNYAVPSNNTLSLVEEACLKIVARNGASLYWNLLTDPATYAIKPDMNNLHMRLRMLRQNRASREALELIQRDIIDAGQTPFPGTFRIAMSTCLRDKNNTNSIKHATQMLDIMTSTFEDIDFKTASLYAELALGWPEGSGSDVITAIQKLEPIVRNIRMQLSVGREASYGMAGAKWLKREDREDAQMTLRRVYGLYDRVINKNEVPEEDKAKFRAERARLAAYIHRVTSKDAKRAENERKKLGDGNDGTGKGKGWKEVVHVGDGEEVEITEAWEREPEEVGERQLQPDRRDRTRDNHPRERPILRGLRDGNQPLTLENPNFEDIPPRDDRDGYQKRPRETGFREDVSERYDRGGYRERPPGSESGILTPQRNDRGGDPEQRRENDFGGYTS